MLLSDLKEIKDGRIIMKGSFIKDSRIILKDGEPKDSKTKDADYKNYYDVGKDVGLSGEKLIQYVEYMRQRWPEKEKSPLELSGYCKEWARRFARGDAWKLSDLSGQRILERMGITDSKSTKDQIAELECQKEQAKKMGYGTDAYDAHIEELKKQEDTFTQDPKTKDEKIPDDPFIKNQIIVAKKTLKMANPMLGVMGGMTKEEARQILKKYGIKVEDSKTKDDYTYPEDFIQFGWNLRQNGSKLIATRGALKYEGSPYEIVPKLKRWLTDYTLEQKYGSKDSKTKDDSRSEEAYDEGYEMALQGKPFSANPYKDVSRSGYADLKESWEDGYRDGRSGKSSNRFRHHH